MRFAFFGALMLLAAPVAASDEVSSAQTGAGWRALILDPLPAEGWVRVFAHETAPLSLGLEWRTWEKNSSSVMTVPSTTTEVGLNQLGGSVGATLLVSRNDSIFTNIPATALPVQLLVWAAGEVTHWGYILDIPPGVNVREVATGSSVHFWDGSERSDGIHLHGSVMGWGASLSNATYPFQVNDWFRGSAGSTPGDWRITPLPPLDLSEDQVTLTRPDGSTEVCRCYAPAFAPWPAGDYSLHWEGHSVFKPNTPQPTLLAGVDAPLWFLPPPAP